MGFTVTPLVLTGAPNTPLAPSGLAFTSDGKTLFVADREAHVIWRVDMMSGGICSVLSGQGKRGFADGKANEATFSNPCDIALDHEGYLLVCDQGNVRLRRVSTIDGSVTTVAGNGIEESLNGVGETASFRALAGVCVDEQGNAYVTDKHNVRKVQPNGVTSTVCGHMKHRGFADGRAGEWASFNYPDGIIYHGGKLFIADLMNSCIRQVSGATRGGGATTTTLGGSGVIGKADGWREFAEFNQPAALTVSPDTTHLLIADTGNAAIRHLSYDGHSMTATLSGVKLSEPRCIRVDPATRNVIVCDSILKKIFVLTPNSDPPTRGKMDVVLPELKQVPGSVTGYHITTVLGKGRGKWAHNDYAGGNGKGVSLEMPNGLAYHKDKLYVSDTGHHSIIVFEDGIATTIAGSGNAGFSDGPGPEASFDRPEFICVDHATDELLVADPTNKRIRRVTADGTVSTWIGNDGGGGVEGTVDVASLSNPYSVTMDKKGNAYIAESCRIRKVSPSPNCIVSTAAGTVPGFAEGDALTEAQFKKPHCSVTDDEGNLYVTDSQNHRIRKISVDGKVSTIAGSVKGYCDGVKLAARFNRPLGILYMGDHLLVCDTNNFRVRRVSLPDGIVTSVCGTGKREMVDGGMGHGSLMGPGAICTDGKGTIWITDLYSHSVRMLTPIIDGVDPLEEKRKAEAAARAPPPKRGPAQQPRANGKTTGDKQATSTDDTTSTQTTSAAAAPTLHAGSSSKRVKAASPPPSSTTPTTAVKSSPTNPSSFSSSAPVTPPTPGSTTTTTTTSTPTTTSTSTTHAVRRSKSEMAVLMGIVAVAATVGVITIIGGRQKRQ